MQSTCAVENLQNEKANIISSKSFFTGIGFLFPVKVKRKQFEV
jgi:hypothetical protein